MVSDRQKNNTSAAPLPKTKRPRITEMRSNASLEAREELINFYDIEDDDTFDYDSLPEAEQIAITKENDKFERNVLIKLMANSVRQCPCICMDQKDRLARRWKKIKAFRNLEEQCPISQKDFDSYTWNVIARSHHGIDQKILYAARICTYCGRQDFFGDNTLIAIRVGKLYMDEIDNEIAKKGAADSGATMVLEDVETGKIIPVPEELKGVLESAT